VLGLGPLTWQTTRPAIFFPAGFSRSSDLADHAAGIIFFRWFWMCLVLTWQTTLRPAIFVDLPVPAVRHTYPLSFLTYLVEQYMADFVYAVPVLRIRYWRKFDLEVADRHLRYQPRKKCPNRWRSHLLPRMRQFLKRASNGHQ